LAEAEDHARADRTGYAFSSSSSAFGVLEVSGETVGLALAAHRVPVSERSDEVSRGTSRYQTKAAIVGD
jgi:hypothetical protein